MFENDILTLFIPFEFVVFLYLKGHYFRIQLTVKCFPGHVYAI